MGFAQALPVQISVPSKARSVTEPGTHTEQGCAQASISNQRVPTDAALTL